LSSVRFPQEPFNLSYTVMYKNPGFLPKPTGTDADNRAAAAKIEWHYTQAVSKKPVAYLEPALSGASFFSHVDVEVNGYPLGDGGPSLSGHGWFYAVFNKTFCSDKLRMEKYAKKIPRVSTEEDRGVTNISADLKACSETLEFDSALTTKPKMCDFGFDG
jgi:hypothetical protein